MRLNKHLNKTEDHERAKELRRRGSPFEQKLWFLLREQSKAHGLRVRRQQPFHPYIVDFVFMDAKLVIEIDGASHDIDPDYDKRREEYLINLGFEILRFSNDDVRLRASLVVETIFEKVKTLKLETK